MDTITHGIAGALISKAAFGGRDLFPPIEMGKKRLITWALMLGAVFPDSDVLRDFFSSNPIADDHLAPQHHAFAALLADLVGDPGRAHGSVGALAQMASSLFPGR